MVLDGNHLEATDKRLGGLPGQALPGQALALLEHGSGLVREVLPWEDAQANEKDVMGAYGLGVRAGDVAVAERQLRAQTVMDLIDARNARFVLRHNGSVGLTVEGARRFGGTGPTGAVYESVVRYAQTDRRLRLVEVELTTPTRTGDAVIRMLTDVPADVADARTIAGAYMCRRWIETVFWELMVSLTCVVKTLAYPRAALFAFCLAVAVYNALQAVRGGGGRGQRAGPVVRGGDGRGSGADVGRAGLGTGTRRVVGGARVGRDGGAAVAVCRGGEHGPDVLPRDQARPHKPRPRPDPSIPFNK